jgi:hypothetical protein
MRNRPKIESMEILKGILLLLAAHILLGPLVLFTGYLVSFLIGGQQSILIFVFVAILGFWFWQLFYVIPIILWLKRRGQKSLMKGVVFGAVLTALMNGASCLIFFASR